MYELSELGLVAIIALSIVAIVAVAGLVLVLLFWPRRDSAFVQDIAWLSAETYDRGFRRGLQRDSDAPMYDPPSLTELRPPAMTGLRSPAPEDPQRAAPKNPDEVDMGFDAPQE